MARDDEFYAGVHVMTGAESSAFLDFSVSSAEQTVTLTAGKWYQVVFDAPNGFVVGKLNATTAALTSVLSNQIFASPGYSPIIQGGVWKWFAQKGAGNLLFIETKS